MSGNGSVPWVLFWAGVGHGPPDPPHYGDPKQSLWFSGRDLFERKPGFPMSCVPRLQLFDEIITLAVSVAAGRTSTGSVEEETIGKVGSWVHTTQKNTRRQIAWISSHASLGVRPRKAWLTGWFLYGLFVSQSSPLVEAFGWGDFWQL